jgi:hypothetical protein
LCAESDEIKTLCIHCLYNIPLVFITSSFFRTAIFRLWALLVDLLPLASTLVKDRVCVSPHQKVC